MSFLSHLADGFAIALTSANFLYCLSGAAIGTLVGVLPGFGPVITIAMLLPFTFKLHAVSSLIMLAGIYYGAHHAGSTTAVMLNMPGEPTSVVICMDGHPMARQGRAGPALSIAALASFFAGGVGVVVIAAFSPLLSEAALSFGSPEYASTVVLALVVTSALADSSVLSTLGMSVLGLLLGTVGADVNAGTTRFTFGFPGLAEGMNLVAVAVAFFAVAEIAIRLGRPEPPRPPIAGIKSLFPTRQDLAASWRPILRGTGLGSVVGVLPGAGPLLASFASYALERRVAKDPGRFGHGAIEGVAGPEAANNAAALTHFVPMLTLGIPAGAAMALMMSSLIVQGIAPGPALIADHPDLFWGVMASMLIGNLMLLILNLPLVGIWIRLLTIPYRLLYPAILVFCCVGVFSVNNATFDIMLAVVLAALGFLFRVLDVSPSPLILALVLGPLLEENVRRSMALSRGDPTIFFTRPVSLSLLIIAAVLLIILLLPALTRRRRE